MKPKFLNLAALAAAVLLTACGANQQPAATVAENPAPAVVQTGDAAPSAREKLVSAIQEKFDDPRFANAHWGVKIQSLKTGETWFARNEGRLFIPASNQKIPTAVSALIGLGKDFRYTTTVAHTGSVVDGRLQGDLIVFGQGDPTFYTQWTKDSRDNMRAWAAQLKAKGITAIDGNIVGDDNAWDDVHTGSGWPGRDITPWYYAEYGALQFNENYVDIKIVPPATADGQVELQPNVPSDYYELVNDIRVTADGRNSIDLDREILTNRIRLSGTVKAGSAALEETPTITNPTLFFVTVLKETLQAEGIEVTGSPVDCDTIPGWNAKPSEASVLIEHQSPPLSEILAKLFKRSQNMYSETMVYTLGWKRTGKGTFGAGREAVGEILEQNFGVKPGEYRYADGSGLSRYNYISPNTICTINAGMRNHPEWETWRDIQSIAGVDGTLRSRMKGTKAENNVRGKTGTLGSVRSLSGYVTTAAGEELVFSFMVNAHTRGSSDTDSITDSVATMLADYQGN